MNDKNKVDFNDYSSSYENLVSDQLSFFSKDRSFFSKYKLDLIKKILPISPNKFLDFGSGIGLSIPFIHSNFPNCTIYATDISSDSLNELSSRYNYCNIIENDALFNYKSNFDCIFLSGVIHHIHPSARESILNSLYDLLTPAGYLVIFEHNPFNPITQRMVSTCPFDADAVLISKFNLSKLCLKNGFKVYDSGYCLFFPPKLSVLSFLEPLLKYIPLGGQHYSIFTKNDFSSQ